MTDYRYDLAGNLARTWTHADDTITVCQYDSLNRLEVLTQYGVHVGSVEPENITGRQILAQFSYSVRADGKRTSVIETLNYDDNNDSQIDEHTGHVDWLYDNLGRLTREIYDSWNNSLDFTADYLFDLVGNRLTKTVDQGRDAVVDEVISYEYDLNDRLLSEAFDHQTDNLLDRFTRYEYGPGADWTDPDDPFGGDHTTQTSKSVWHDLSDDIDRTDAPDELTTYTYNLQGRMDSATVDSDADGNADSYSEYQYDDSGIRVAASEQVDANDDGDLADTGDRDTRTDYLVDHRNPTGYAQVLEEMLDPDGDGTAQATLQKSYTIGHDILLEAVASGQIRRLLKDGHGSTRALVDALGNVIQNGTTPQIYTYDAYGNPIGFSVADALTTHLYSGEQTDQLTGLQYLRARYYNPSTGTFNRLDPFFGNLNDPQSLHKYLYCHGDPVNGIDPSGLDNMPTLMASMSLRMQMFAGGYGAAVFQIIRNYATDQPWHKGVVEAGIKGALLFPMMMKYPLLMLGMAGAAVWDALGVSLEVLRDPDAEPHQHVAASLLIVGSLFFMRDASCYYGSWTGGRLLPELPDEAFVMGIIERSGMAKNPTRDINGEEVIIWGQEHSSSTTDGHAETIAGKAAEKANSGEYAHVLMQRSLRTALGRWFNGMRKIPDLVCIRRDGRVDVYEVRSNNQTRFELESSLEAIMNELPPEMQGSSEVFEPGS